MRNLYSTMNPTNYIKTLQHFPQDLSPHQWQTAACTQARLNLLVIHCLAWTVTSKWIMVLFVFDTQNIECTGLDRAHFWMLETILNLSIPSKELKSGKFNHAVFLPVDLRLLKNIFCWNIFIIIQYIAAAHICQKRASPHHVSFGTSSCRLFFDGKMENNTQGSSLALERHHLPTVLQKDGLVFFFSLFFFSFLTLRLSFCTFSVFRRFLFRTLQSTFFPLQTQSAVTTTDQGFVTLWSGAQVTVDVLCVSGFFFLFFFFFFVCYMPLLAWPACWLFPSPCILFFWFFGHSSNGRL